jgi:transposase
MKIIPAATTVELTPEERQVLEAVAGSSKAEARMRDRARIVLLASADMESRAIAREVRCTPGTVSKWRVRYANERIAALSETGDRGNEPKYGPEHLQRIGQSHDYKRHGTSTLFAALNVGTGQVIGKHYKRRRRLEFRDFMNRVVKQYEGKEIHVILDNLSTHKPKRDLWLARHPNVHFHYTPTDTSWLNQIEIWFSILAAQSLKGASVGSVAELVAHIESFINSYDEDILARSSGPKAPSPKTAQAMFRGLTILGASLAIHPASPDVTFGRSRPDVTV